ncbi:MAG TPA: dihydroorotate dehydrogenase electron transfer subunit [bacterium]|nr:dihydroorotate dehydrogenase electron transfer subunit [bacterium]
MKNIVAVPNTVKITDITHVNSRMTTIELDARIEMDPGQFIMLWIPRVDEKPFSVVAPDPLTLSVACIGPFTNKLKEMKAGDKLGWRGPYGKGFRIIGKKVLIVGGGCGLASVYHLITACTKQGLAVDVVAAFKTAEEAFLLEEIKATGANVNVCTDDGTEGFKGYATDKVKELIADKTYDQVYSCGPEIMMSLLRDVLDRAKLPYQFSLERYMKCGIGICDKCSINGQLVCQDGPVFNQDQIKQLTEFGKFKRIGTGEKVPSLPEAC